MIYSYDIFISHSSKNKKEVRALAERLKQDGYKVWFDDWEIFVGDDIPKKIIEGVNQSKFVAIWLTKDAVSSFWVEEEWSAKFFNQGRNGAPVIFPLKSEECEIPQYLRKKKYADFTQSFDQGYEQMLLALEHSSLRFINECFIKLIKGEEDAEFAAHTLYRLTVFNLNEGALHKLWEASLKTRKPYTTLDHIVYYYTKIMLETKSQKIKQMAYKFLEDSVTIGTEAMVDKYSYAAGDILLKSHDSEQKQLVSSFVKKQLSSNVPVVNFWYNNMKKRVDENDYSLLN